MKYNGGMREFTYILVWNIIYLREGQTNNEESLSLKYLVFSRAACPLLLAGRMQDGWNCRLHSQDQHLGRVGKGAGKGKVPSPYLRLFSLRSNFSESA